MPKKSKESNILSEPQQSEKCFDLSPLKMGLEYSDPDCSIPLSESPCSKLNTEASWTNPMSSPSLKRNNQNTAYFCDFEFEAPDPLPLDFIAAPAASLHLSASDSNLKKQKGLTSWALYQLLSPKTHCTIDEEIEKERQKLRLEAENSKSDQSKSYPSDSDCSISPVRRKSLPGG